VDLPGREADVGENYQQGSDRLKLPVSTSVSHVPSSKEGSRGDADGVGDEMSSSRSRGREPNGGEKERDVVEH